MSLSEKERREFIENRRKGSAIWQLIHLCGSLRLAMVELFTIAIACAVATICESKFNTQVARAYIYDAPWFIFWLAVLCVNLFCVTLTRWPWQRKHWGFVITHYGIIMLLVGAMVGQKFGFEANITLHTGQEPSGQLITNQTVLQMDSEFASYTVPLDVDVRPPTPSHTKTFVIPDRPPGFMSELAAQMAGKTKIVVDNYTEKLVESTELVDSPIPKLGPGIALEFSSGMMAQKIPMNLVHTPESGSTNEFFGRAQVKWLDALPDRSGVKPPEGMIRETQMVFAKYQPVVTSPSGKQSGYRIQLVADGPAPQVVITSPKDEQKSYPLTEIIGKPLTFSDDTLVVVKNYWPDMEMQDGKPVSKSDQPNNPAILVTLKNDGTTEKPLLELASTGAGEVAYQMSRGGYVQTSGKVKVGQSFSIGWADWKAQVKKVVPNAMMQMRVEPAKGPAGMGDQVISGIHAYLIDHDGNKGQPAWIPSGQARMLEIGNRGARIGFGLKIRNLDFGIRLLSFNVPRDEGTDTPSDFVSRVEFSDPSNAATAQGSIHMNHPASYPVGFWRSVLGTNYKFSQAQWNPRDPGETTLQVLHDPGWPLKWSGSLLICCGIAIMFYLKPKSTSKANGRKPAAKVPMRTATTNRK